MKTLEELKESMECNGYAYFNEDAFFNNALEICYIPENAEDLEDCFTYLDLRSEVEEFVKNNPNYLKEHETTIEDILKLMFENIEWTFPSTYLNELV